MKSFLVVIVLFVVFASCYDVMGFCFEEAGKLYGISPLLLKAISEIESGGNPNAINRNRDGSYDFGLMQINSSWAETLGVDNWLKLGDPCFNVKVGAWVLSKCFKRYGHTWEAVGCYNAKSSSKRAAYAHRIYRKLNELDWR